MPFKSNQRPRSPFHTKSRLQRLSSRLPSLLHYSPKKKKKKKNTKFKRCFLVLLWWRRGATAVVAVSEIERTVHSQFLDPACILFGLP
ncbi:hypothetical protein ACOSP7_011442 [Xanthoceras sorbifolium]